MQSETVVSAGAAPTSGTGQAWSIASLIVSGLTALAVGLGLYRALASIELSFDPFGGVVGWGMVVLVGLCLGPVACALGIVAAIRGRRRAIGWVALVTAFALPVTAGGIGLVQGVDKLRSGTVRTVVSAGDGIACLVGAEGWEGLNTDTLRRVLEEANG